MQDSSEGKADMDNVLPGAPSPHGDGSLDDLSKVEMLLFPRSDLPSEEPAGRMAENASGTHNGGDMDGQKLQKATKTTSTFREAAASMLEMR